MKKKIMIGSIIAVLMLLTISFASAVNTNDTTNVQKKESPLFGIRTRRAITEKITNILENIRAKFIGERMFFVPFYWLNGGHTSSGYPMDEKPRYTGVKYDTCDGPYTCALPGTACAWSGC